MRINLNNPEHRDAFMKLSPVIKEVNNERALYNSRLNSFCDYRSSLQKDLEGITDPLERVRHKELIHKYSLSIDNLADQQRKVTTMYATLYSKVQKEISSAQDKITSLTRRIESLKSDKKRADNPKAIQTQINTLSSERKRLKSEYTSAIKGFYAFHENRTGQPIKV